MGALALLFATVPTGQSARTATNREAVVVGMPFSGKWAWKTRQASCGSDRCDSYPGYHEPRADWATDLYAAPGTEVKLQVMGATGKIRFSVAPRTTTSCGAGQRVRIYLRVDDVSLGYVQYEHLDTKGIDFSSVSNGTTLGRLRNWGDLYCYRVTSDAGVHAHVTVANTTNRSCFINYSEVGIDLPRGRAIGILGANDTASPVPCRRGPSVSAYKHFIVQWSGDTKTQKTAWWVNSELRRYWIPTAAVYYCLKDAKGYPGPVALPGPVLALLPDSGDRVACASNTPPTVTSIDGATSGVVYSDAVPLTIHFRDSECDVTGGKWEGATGSGLRETFTARSLRCSSGLGSLVYHRTCYWAGRWTEYMTLVDRQGNRSPRFPFTYSCR